MDKKPVHIFCGEGKGKTTAALGQGIRAASQGQSVIIIQFLKGSYTEDINFIQRLEPEIKLLRFEKSEIPFEELPEELRKEEVQNIRNGLNFAKKVMVTEECDVLILDEVLGLLQYDIATPDELKNLLMARNRDMELILTGIDDGRELWDYVDVVTKLSTVYKSVEE